MKALIEPQSEVKYISGWNPPVAPATKYTPIETVCGVRIAEVTEESFPVAPPLFWVDCENNVKAETYCYVENSQSIILIPPNEPDPSPQPVSTGTNRA